MNRKNVKKFTVSKSDIISASSEIKDLLAHGKRFRSGNITIIYRESDQHGVGFIASRHIGSAVKRNRAKRILREAYRMNKETFKDVKVLFLIRSGITFGNACKAAADFRDKK